MKGNLLAAAFATLFTASTYAHPRVSESLQFKVSIDVAEVTEDPTFGVLFFAGADIAENGEFYTEKQETSCIAFVIEEPEIDVGSVTLFGFANCTLFDDSAPPKEYNLLSAIDEAPVTVPIDPPTIFLGGKCCAPEDDGDDAKRSH